MLKGIWGYSVILRVGVGRGFFRGFVDLMGSYGIFVDFLFFEGVDFFGKGGESRSEGFWGGCDVIFDLGCFRFRLGLVVGLGRRGFIGFRRFFGVVELGELRVFSAG